MNNLEGLELAKKIVDILSDKQASDIVLKDVQELCNFADYFVICSGESTRQLKAMIDAVSDFLKIEKVRNHEEGTPESGWILLDAGDVIIHVFSLEEREFYKLEDLWEKAPTRVRIP